MKKGGSVTQHIPAPNAPGAVRKETHKTKKDHGGLKPNFYFKKEHWQVFIKGPS